MVGRPYVGHQADPAGGGLGIHDIDHLGHHFGHPHRGQPQRDLAELDVRQIGQVVEQPAQPLGVTEGDLQEALGVLSLLQRAGQQRLEIALDRGERRAQLV